MSRGRDQQYRVALVVPLQGSEGMFGPSCELCARLAAGHVNARGGVLGRELVLIVVDGARSPVAVADQIELLLHAGEIDAVVGWHISAVREAVAPRIAGRIPYVYTALYEGAAPRPGVFFTGETPGAQVVPALSWMASEMGVRRWTVVGNDYIWPRRSAAAGGRGARAIGVDLVDSVFVPLGTTDFGPALRRIEQSDTGGVLMFLVGEDAVRFNRQFAEAGLDACWQRLTPLMDENMLMASGAEAVHGIFTAAGYFEALPTPENLQFSGDFARAYGIAAPVLNSAGESCFEGIQMLAAVMQRAGSPAMTTVRAAAENLHYDGPRGTVEVRAGHVRQRIYMATPTDLEYDILACL
jgi:urea transport system substrate-binding protein